MQMRWSHRHPAGVQAGCFNGGVNTAVAYNGTKVNTGISGSGTVTASGDIDVTVGRQFSRDSRSQDTDAQHERGQRCGNVTAAVNRTEQKTFVKDVALKAASLDVQSDLNKNDTEATAGALATGRLRK